MNSVKKMHDTVFGDVGEDYCKSLYIYMVASFIVAVLSTLSVISGTCAILLKSNMQNVPLWTILGGIIGSLMMLSITWLNHFAMRALHTVCIKVL
jgi:uncharacterized membrane protein YdcZ (DUF606 family)